VRLAEAYKVPVKKSALHVYHSAIVTMPSCRLQEETSKDYPIPVLVSERLTNWPRILEGLQRNQVGHTRQVRAVAFSGDGMFVVSGSEDCTSRVWNAETGVELSILSGHTGPVTSVALSRDGRFVVSGSEDSTVRVWEATTGRELYILTNHEREVSSVAFSGNDDLVVSGSHDYTARVWNMVADTQLYILKGHESAVLSVAFSHNGSFIVSSSYDQTIRLWDAATGMHLRTITSHTNWWNPVAFLGNTSSIVSRSISGDGTMQVWEPSPASALDDSFTSLPQYVEASDSCRYDQLKLERNGWISRLGTQNTWGRVCWLPAVRHGWRIAHFGQTVCIGAESGAFTILNFSRVRST
jgi:WD40 repeat protein